MGLPRLYSIEEATARTEGMDCFATVAAWVHEFLDRRHPDLGRSGKVCPYVHQAIALHTIKLAALDIDGLDIETITNTVRELLGAFLEDEPRTGEARLNKAYLLILPGLSETMAGELIETIHHRLKPEFVKNGVMIGKFHPLSEAPGLHNPDFRPLRSPVPLLAIRYLVPNDLVFMTKRDEDPGRHREYLESYLRLASTWSDTPAAKVKAAREKLDELSLKPCQS